MNKREAKRIACSLTVSAIECAILDEWASDEIAKYNPDITIGDTDIRRVVEALEEIQDEMSRRAGELASATSAESE